MLPLEHSAILLMVLKTSFLSFREWPLYTGFTVLLLQTQKKSVVQLFFAYKSFYTTTVIVQALISVRALVFDLAQLTCQKGLTAELQS